MAVSFPVEIITLCLKEYHDDEGMKFLWTECRNVSKTWRNIVEDIFAVRFLPDMKLVWTVFLGPGGELKLFPGCDQIEFDFLCCGPSDGDKNIAYFKSSWEWGTFDGLTFLEHSEWATWTAPLLTTTIRGLCNDTEIVDLSTQLPKISCDWKRTLSRLFGEETRVEKQADQLSRRLANIPVGPRTIKHHCYMSQRRQRIEKQCEAAEARHRWSLAKADLRLKWVDTSFWSSVAEERMRLWSRNGGVSENKIGEEQIRLEVMCSYREQGMRFTEFSR